MIGNQVHERYVALNVHVLFGQAVLFNTLRCKRSELQYISDVEAGTCRRRDTMLAGGEHAEDI